MPYASSDTSRARENVTGHRTPNHVFEHGGKDAAPAGAAADEDIEILGGEL